MIVYLSYAVSIGDGKRLAFANDKMTAKDAEAQRQSLPSKPYLPSGSALKVPVTITEMVELNLGQRK